MQRTKWNKPFGLVLLASLFVPFTSISGTLENAVNTQVKTDVSAQKSQQKVDKLSNETKDIVATYRETLRQTTSLRTYNDQLEKLVTSQKKELGSMDGQLRNIENTQRDIVPLMLKMIETIVQFVDLDIPFLPEERQQRIVQLQTLMERADVSIAEKYRRILEAYQVETEYGRTIEAYRGDLIMGDDTRTVDFLRIGRVSLYYLTLDSQEAGIWNDNQWQKLDNEYRQAIEQGLKVAKKQLPPNLLVLPTQIAEVAQ
ncbi:MAG: hypothetical protein COA95_02525 [Methylophaga sp.]|nr:MAG: hypothetical protein COA95_02525 [Methylophaga sp.]